jgi:ABC-type multidrug transport system fused ATPase/permease subunit
MFVTTYIYMHTWVVTAELSGKRIRERYLQSVLRQDPTFFDSVGAGEIVTRIQTDTREYVHRTSTWLTGVIQILCRWESQRR